METCTSGSEVRVGETEGWQRPHRAPARPYHFGVRLEEANQCILVVIGATAEGTKELLALTDGFRESEESWKDVLLD